MDRKKRYTMFTMAAIGVLVILIFGWGTPALDEEKDIYQLSYIYRSYSMEESQQAIRQGIEQAAKDFKCEVTAVAFDSSISSDEQVELIKREVKNGADAILIEPLNDAEVAAEIKEVRKKIPVVQMNAWIKSEEGEKDKLPTAHVDSYEMGQRLAKKLVKDINTSQSVLIIESEMNYMDIYEACRGIKEHLKDKGIRFEEAVMTGGELGGAEEMLEVLKTTEAGAVIVFGTPQLEMCGKLKKENLSLSNMAIYGIGKSNQIISYLEEKMIQAIGVTNEYSTGYLGAMEAMNELKGGGMEETSIDFSIIDINNIYTTKNQRLLFPFVQ